MVQTPQLDAEIGRLREFVAGAQALLRELGAARDERDAALAEVASLRGELDRVGRERSGAAADDVARADGLAQARALLAEARALTASLDER